MKRAAALWWGSGGCSENLSVKGNVWAVSPQEGSGFDDFDSDDEVLRVSELLLDLHKQHLLFLLQAHNTQFCIPDILSLGPTWSSWTPRTARASRSTI